MTKTPHNPDELLAVVDAEDHIIGRVPRKEIGGKLHREVYVLIINLKNEILLQKRSDNGRMDFSVAGHFPHDQDYLTAAVRETEEELGLKLKPSEFTLVEKKRVNPSKQFVHDKIASLYVVKGDYKIQDMKIDKSELSYIKYFNASEIAEPLKDENNGVAFREMVTSYLKKVKLIQ
jgi:isopentenyldiphosphate isomerase